MEAELYYTETIKNKIYTIRGVQVMLDFDLAEIYGYEVKALNQQVKRNINRFPEDFMFQISSDELNLVKSQIMTLPLDNLKSQIVTSSWGGTRKLPNAFTEQGIYMLATVLRGELAEQQSIFIMRAFREMKRFVLGNSKTKLTTQDIQMFNSQYPTLTLNYTTRMHDRFLIIDQTTLYHIGASLKDLGKKCFAFEVLDSSLIGHILNNL